MVTDLATREESTTEQAAAGLPDLIERRRYGTHTINETGGAPGLRLYLWIADINAKHLAAPIWLGGQRFEEQERIVRERAARDGIVLPDRDLRLGEERFSRSWERRIAEMVDDLKQTPAKRVYIPRAVFTHDSRYQGDCALSSTPWVSRLIICDE